MESKQIDQSQQEQKQRGRKSATLLLLLILLVTITVGFAVLSTTLNISGTSKIVNEHDWCVGPKCGEGQDECTDIETCSNPPITCPANEVCTILDCDAHEDHCENIPTPDTCTDKSREGEEGCKGAVIWMVGDTIYFKHILTKPGDVFTFNARFDNGGDLDAKVADVTKSELNATAQDFMTYDVTYSDDTAVSQNDELAAGSSVTYKVKVAYKSSVTTLPTEAQLALINETAQGHDGATSLFTVNYQQK